MGDPVTMGLLGGLVMGGGRAASDAATAGAAREENTVANKWAPLLALNHSRGAAIRPMPNQNPFGALASGVLGGLAFGQANPLGMGGVKKGGANIGPLLSGLGELADPARSSDSDMAEMARGGFARGGMIPGVPKVPGNSFKNDFKPIMASPGETVVPRSVMKNPKQKIAAFLNEVKKHGPGPLPMHGGGGMKPKISPWGAMACGGMVGKK